MSIAENLLPEFDSEFASTRKILALVPDDKLTWKPHEKSMALGRLAWHVSDFPSWCAETLKKDFLEFSPEDGPKMANEWKDKTREKILERFDADIKIAREALSSTSDEKWPQPWKMLWGGQAVIDEPRREVYRRVVMNHMVHHRAQLGVYLRLNGIPIPGVYGPSADEM